ncbi:hypothetical protein HNR60_000891 [Rhodopseudomonas rhenobacensis]|uniref:DUF2971 domain-containing protein n=1 Tax=Rhodopseudomonas rhenobacensis TaxID=87461 RepID=A0A7W7Z181_9BRAD|nr:DUF2971 domain-containing protein [Rhodopseudomonas rhenobacensis]MBB5046149.1 hypothetical protein [Rhodopseudomonas rhenobacensis]
MNNKIGKKKKRKLLDEAAASGSPAVDHSGEDPAAIDRKDTHLYKYAGSQLVDAIFSSPERVTMKCSLPKDFNDPYELFLTIDFDEEPDALAFYADAVGELVQQPTTCFSRSPDVVPMWAHYAENHKGFVVEFSETCLAKAFPESSFGDVTYSDVPSEGLTDMLYRAFRIGKYRYIYLLRLGVYRAAYYTKATCWSYERERRMVASETEIRDASDLLLLDAPVQCVRSIIAGSRATDATKDALKRKAHELGCRYFEIRIGRVTAIPYFLDLHERPHIFDGSALIPAAVSCSTCFEPMKADSSQTECSWCRINQQMTQYAASRNSYRMLDRAGLLDSYIEGMDKITFGS